MLHFRFGSWVGGNAIYRTARGTVIYEKDGTFGSPGGRSFEVITGAPWVPVAAEAPSGLCGDGEVHFIGTWDLLPRRTERPISAPSWWSGCSTCCRARVRTFSGKRAEAKLRAAMQSYMFTAEAQQACRRRGLALKEFQRNQGSP